MPKNQSLTPKIIKSLSCPPGKRQVYFPFNTETHLYLAVYSSGSKSFVYRRKLEGTYREIKIAKFRDSDDDVMARALIKAAEAKSHEMESKVSNWLNTSTDRRGLNPFDLRLESSQDPTLRELFNIYLERHAKKSRKTAADMEKNFERWFGAIANRKAGSITRQQAENLHASIGSRAPYAANRAVQLIRPAYNKAIEWKVYSGENPFAGITLFDEYSRDRFLSGEEARSLVDALPPMTGRHDDDRTLRDFIMLDLMLGVRKGVLRSMRWEDINGSNWEIPGELTKNKTGQIIPLGRREIEILNARQELMVREGIDSPYVFPGKGKTGHLMELKRSFKSLRIRAGFGDPVEKNDLSHGNLTIHDLRRSLAAAMASQNVNVALIKSAMHHKDLKTTIGIYAKTNKQAELEARQLAQDMLFETEPSNLKVKRRASKTKAN